MIQPLCSQLAAAETLIGAQRVALTTEHEYPDNDYYSLHCVTHHGGCPACLAWIEADAAHTKYRYAYPVEKITI